MGRLQIKYLIIIFNIGQGLFNLTRKFGGPTAPLFLAPVVGLGGPSGPLLGAFGPSPNPQPPNPNTQPQTPNTQNIFVYQTF